MPLGSKEKSFGLHEIANLHEHKFFQHMAQKSYDDGRSPFSRSRIDEFGSLAVVILDRSHRIADLDYRRSG
jgi:hypothetical protein